MTPTSSSSGSVTSTSPRMWHRIIERRGGSAIDARTTRHAGYEVSQRIRKRIEECFGWGKTVGGLRQTKYRRTRKVDFQFVLTMTAYNLVRLRNLLPPAPA